jgi:hypothetical protein
MCFKALCKLVSSRAPSGSGEYTEEYGPWSCPPGRTGPVHAALGYARNQRIALRRFLDVSLPVHSNISELNLRRQVLGCRNWLFVGSDDGAAVNTVFVSLLASAPLHNIEPHGYLRDLFCLLRTWPCDRLLKLAPVYWQKILEQPELSRSWLPTSSAPSCSRRRPDPRIAPFTTARRRLRH